MNKSRLLHYAGEALVYLKQVVHGPAIEDPKQCAPLLKAGWYVEKALEEIKGEREWEDAKHR